LALASENALNTAAGSQGYFSTSSRRIPVTCMIGKMPVRLK
jgi:hypothetical protein